GFNGGFG
nr:Chain A, TAR DNA-binding protein 43 [Homo sapiens]5WIQ_B Chain B, TAR DNA-binding protein 43 [Homo sapiens]